MIESLEEDEKRIFNMICNNGEVLQSELVDVSGHHKSKICRILKKLEARNMIKRERRGLTCLISLRLRL
ncbi:MAG: helix-turn-helix transcriptional regulator [Candidatus Methanofastidiosia archaeon]